MEGDERMLEHILKAMGMPNHAPEPLSRRCPCLPLPLKPAVFTPEQQLQLNTLIASSQGEGKELEASFGNFTDSQPGRMAFRPGVTKEAFWTMVRRLMDVVKRTSGAEQTIEVTHVEICNGKNLRRITFASGETIIQRKDRNVRTQLNLPEWGIRVSESEEVTVDASEWTEAADLSRQRKRFMFSGIVKGFRIDLTVVQQTVKGSTPDRASQRYEVELERVEREVDAFSAEGGIVHVLKMLQGAPTKEGFDGLMRCAEKKHAARQFNSLFRVSQERGVVTGWWNKPRVMQLNELLSPGSWSVSIKMDGVRRFVLIAEDATYMFGPPHEIYKLGPGNRALSGTLIDGEYVASFSDETMTQFYMIDLVFYKRRDVRDQSFVDRMKKLQSVTIQMFAGTSKLIPTYESEKAHDAVRHALAAMDALDPTFFPTDGLVLRRADGIHGKYINEKTFKWKPSELLTIDFLLAQTISENPRRLTGNDFYLLTLDPRTRGGKGRGRGRYRLFQGTSSHPHPGTVSIPPGTTSCGIPYEVNQVVEFAWDGTKFTPHRIRHDRGNEPNGTWVAKSAWDALMNPVAREAMEGVSSVQLMRHYHKTICDKMTEEHHPKLIIEDLAYQLTHQKSVDALAQFIAERLNSGDVAVGLTLDGNAVRKAMLTAEVEREIRLRPKSEKEAKKVVMKRLNKDGEAWEWKCGGTCTIVQSCEFFSKATTGDEVILEMHGEPAKEQLLLYMKPLRHELKKRGVALVNSFFADASAGAGVLSSEVQTLSSMFRIVVFKKK